jgi:hypothetical protein
LSSLNFDLLNPHSLRSSYIGDAGAQRLAEALARDTTLQKLE